jgi:multidrug efflux system membrane fusion protein
MKRVVMAIAFLALLAGGAFAYRWLLVDPAQSQTAQPPRPSPAVPVLVTPAERQAMPVRLDAIGTVQTMASVGVKSRIDAQIAQVKVRDGQYVRTGDVLFQLDSRAAEAQLHQAQAQIVRDRAQLANAKRDVERFAPLVAKDFVSRQQYDTAVTNAQALDATVKSDEAAIENAQVLLSYYTIASPIDGRLGMVTLKVGNNVKANDVAFLAINQVKPIYALFSVSERELPAIRAAMAAGPVMVRARPAGDNDQLIEGKLAFFDNTVDIATGTIALRAIFENQDERLWPGTFVNVSMTLSLQADALVVPQAAVQIGQNNPFVFVVKDDNTAEARKVEVSRTIDGKSIIASGLEPGERVVIDGQLRLSNGSRVDIRQPQAQPASGKTS